MSIIIFFSAFLLVILCTMAIPLLVGILVYRDADKRVDCNPWLWALIAALAPSFVGLIIYLVVRGDYPLKEMTLTYDEFGNPVPQKPAGFPKWAKVLLIVFAVLFIVLFLGGCVAAMYSIFTFDHTNMDHIFYAF
ncbi:MAG: hypothetical protein IKJ77_09220 [Firmicutes bacterium]|nr:hypothetical protein [Bacillota bacterium]